MDTTNFMNDIPMSAAIAAHAGTSWTPERRGASERQEYADTLAADYAHFAEQARKGGTLDMLADEFARYRAGYAKRTRAYLHSRQGLVSWMIAGPSRFPVARMQKKGDISHRRLSEMIEWRSRARNAIIRNLRPDLAPIMAGDADALDRLDVKIADAERFQVFMRAANKIVRAHHKAGLRAEEDSDLWRRYLAQLTELHVRIGASHAAKLLQPDFCGRIGFADYELTNNGANIRRMKQRREQITAAQARPVETRKTESGITLEDDPPANRIRLFFPGKPAEAVRTDLKRQGFRWTPSPGCWQAYRNTWSLQTAQTIAGAQAKGAA